MGDVPGNNAGGTVGRRDAEHADRLARYLAPLMKFIEHDDDVVEVYTRPGDGAVFTERRSRGRTPEGVSLDPVRIDLALRAAADRDGTVFTRDREHLESQLPQHRFRGARLQGARPGVVSTPVLTIRKHSSVLIPLSEYEAEGIMPAGYRQACERMAREGRGYLIAGEMGSGKTTLLNALIEAARAADGRLRFVILEDKPEVQCRAEDRLHLRVTDNSDLEVLSRMTKRFSPDRIVVGEVLGAEALTLLSLLNTGHGGMCTIHAGDPGGALRQLHYYARFARDTDHREIIAAVIDFVIIIRRETSVEGASTRRVTQIVRVDDRLGPDGEFVCRPICPHTGEVSTVPAAGVLTLAHHGT